MAGWTRRPSPKAGTSLAGMAAGPGVLERPSVVIRPPGENDAVQVAVLQGTAGGFSSPRLLVCER